MKIKRLFRRAAALLCAAAMAVTLPVHALADSPQLRVCSTSGCPDSTVTVIVQGEFLTDLAGLEGCLHYNDTILTLVSAQMGGLDLFTVNTATAGEVRFNGASITPLDGDMQLLEAVFNIRSDAPEGTYPLTVTVGDAYSSAGGACELAAVDGTLTVKAAQPTVKSQWYYSNTDQYTLHQGDTLIMDTHCYDLQDLAAGKLMFTYDQGLFDFVSLEPLSGLSGAVTASEGSHSGQASLVFASAEAITNYELARLKLQVKADVDADTRVSLALSDLYDADRNSILGYGYDRDFQLQKQISEVDLPDLRIIAPTAQYTNVPLAVTVMVEGSSALAAGDFRITYDPTVLRCDEAVKATALPAGVSVVVNPTINQGAVNFSMICAQGLTTDTDLLTLRFTPLAEATTTITPSVQSRTVDREHHDAALEMMGTTCTLTDPWFTVSFQDENGTELKSQSVRYRAAATPPEDPTKAPDDTYHYAFSGWDTAFNSIAADLTVTAQYTASAHVPQTDAAVTATCTTAGLTAGSHCSVCQRVLTAQTVVPALGHDYGSVVTPPSCTEKGYTTYTCSRCQHSYKADYVDALGHDWDAPIYEWSADNKEVTAWRTCKRDAAHTETEKVETTSQVTVAAVGVKDGLRTYTAAFTNAAFAVQTKTEVIPAPGITISGSTGCGAKGTATLYLEQEPVKSAPIANGLFALSGVMAGDYTLVIHHVGYLDEVVQVTIGAAAETYSPISVQMLLAGDINGAENPAHEDAGRTSPQDMQRLFEHLCGAKILTGQALRVADVNCDDAINILDYQALYMLLQS